MEDTPDINEVIAALLRGHGVQGSEQNGWFVPESGGPPVSAEIISDQDHGTQHVVQLDVRLALEDGRTLIESFGGWGPSYREAVGRALENFAVHSLHVLIGALLAEPDEQVTVEEWEVAGAQWKAVIGNFGGQSTTGDAPIPDGLFETFERCILGESLRLDVHWFRMYYCNIGTGNVMSEALWDNEYWNKAAEAVAALPWEARDSFYSMRCFMVLKRMD